MTEILMKQAYRNSLSGTYSNFKVEWLKDPNIQRLGNKDLIIVNSVRSPSEMQTGPYYCDRPITIPETQTFISKVTVYIH